MQVFQGYPRENGSVGIRNWVGVLSAMDNVNPVTRGICLHVRNTLPITTLFVRGQYGRDEEITIRALVGLGSNPNIGACLVVGLEETSTYRLSEAIARTGKPVETVIVQQEGGTVDALALGIKKAQRLAIMLSRQRQVPSPLSSLVVGVECGGSDTTSGIGSNPAVGVVSDAVVDAGGTIIISETSEFLGAEHLFAERAVNEDVRRRIIEVVANVEQEALKQGVDIRGTNPVPDNIRGGLTTIEEKALGAMAKAGTKPVQGVLAYAEQPAHTGLWMMDTPAPAVESITALAASGCQMILFTTGVGNTIGSAVAPTIKITANEHTARRFTYNVDIDVSDVLSAGLTIAEAGQRVLAGVLDVGSGMLTTSESLSQVETGISRFGPTI